MKSSKKITQLLLKACSIAGSQSALGREINADQQKISYWIKRGILPVEFAGKIEKATGGEVTRQQLFPDLFQ